MKTQNEYIIDGMKAHKRDLEKQVDDAIAAYYNNGISLSELSSTLSELNESITNLLLEINYRTPITNDDEIPF